MTTTTLPLRFTVCTYNIWTDTRWPERRPALQAFVRAHMPDILCVQELQSDSKAALDEVLSATHTRVEDPFEGWTREGNIYFNSTLFEIVEHGAEQIGICEEFRRLFWVRLRVKGDSGDSASNTTNDKSLLVSTAHYTWFGHVVPMETEKNVRIPQARATLETLARIGKPDEPQLFMGDLNDQGEPIRVLMNGGLTPNFMALGRYPAFTHPAIPTAVGAPCTIDWMMHRGAIRPMTAEVVDFYHNEIAPSDHKPVLATYRFEGA